MGSGSSTSAASEGGGGSPPARGVGTEVHTRPMSAPSPPSSVPNRNPRGSQPRRNHHNNQQLQQPSSVGSTGSATIGGLGERSPTAAAPTGGSPPSVTFHRSTENLSSPSRSGAPNQPATGSNRPPSKRQQQQQPAFIPKPHVNSITIENAAEVAEQMRKSIGSSRISSAYACQVDAELPDAFHSLNEDMLCLQTERAGRQARKMVGHQQGRHRQSTLSEQQHPSLMDFVGSGGVAGSPQQQNNERVDGGQRGPPREGSESTSHSHTLESILLGAAALAQRQGGKRDAPSPSHHNRVSPQDGAHSLDVSHTHHRKPHKSHKHTCPLRQLLLIREEILALVEHALLLNNNNGTIGDSPNSTRATASETSISHQATGGVGVDALPSGSMGYAPAGGGSYSPLLGVGEGASQTRQQRRPSIVDWNSVEGGSSTAATLRHDSDELTRANGTLSSAGGVAGGSSGSGVSAAMAQPRIPSVVGVEEDSLLGYGRTVTADAEASTSSAPPLAAPHSYLASTGANIVLTVPVPTSSRTSPRDEDEGGRTVYCPHILHHAPWLRPQPTPPSQSEAGGLSNNIGSSSSCVRDTDAMLPANYLQHTERCLAELSLHRVLLASTQREDLLDGEGCNSEASSDVVRDRWETIYGYSKLVFKSWSAPGFRQQRLRGLRRSYHSALQDLRRVEREARRRIALDNSNDRHRRQRNLENAVESWSGLLRRYFKCWRQVQSEHSFAKLGRSHGLGNRIVEAQTSLLRHFEQLQNDYLREANGIYFSPMAELTAGESLDVLADDEAPPASSPAQAVEWLRRKEQDLIAAAATLHIIQSLFGMSNASGMTPRNIVFTHARRKLIRVFSNSFATLGSLYSPSPPRPVPSLASAALSPSPHNLKKKRHIDKLRQLVERALMQNGGHDSAPSEPPADKSSPPATLPLFLSALDDGGDPDGFGTPSISPSYHHTAAAPSATVATLDLCDCSMCTDSECSDCNDDGNDSNGDSVGFGGGLWSSTVNPLGSSSFLPPQGTGTAPLKVMTDNYPPSQGSSTNTRQRHQSHTINGGSHHRRVKYLYTSHSLQQHIKGASAMIPRLHPQRINHKGEGKHHRQPAPPTTTTGAAQDDDGAVTLISLPRRGKHHTHDINDTAGQRIDMDSCSSSSSSFSCSPHECLSSASAPHSPTDSEASSSIGVRNQRGNAAAQSHHHAHQGRHRHGSNRHRRPSSHLVRGSYARSRIERQLGTVADRSSPNNRLASDANTPPWLKDALAEILFPGVSAMGGKYESSSNMLSILRHSLSSSHQPSVGAKMPTNNNLRPPMIANSTVDSTAVTWIQQGGGTHIAPMPVFNQNDTASYYPQQQHQHTPVSVLSNNSFNASRGLSSGAFEPRPPSTTRASTAADASLEGSMLSRVGGTNSGVAGGSLLGAGLGALAVVGPRSFDAGEDGGSQGTIDPSCAISHISFGTHTRPQSAANEMIVSQTQSVNTSPLATGIQFRRRNFGAAAETTITTSPVSGINQPVRPPSSSPSPPSLFEGGRLNASRLNSGGGSRIVGASGLLSQPPQHDATQVAAGVPSLLALVREERSNVLSILNMDIAPQLSGHLERLVRTYVRMGKRILRRMPANGSDLASSSTTVPSNRTSASEVPTAMSLTSVTGAIKRQASSIRLEASRPTSLKSGSGRGSPLTSSLSSPSAAAKQASSGGTTTPAHTQLQRQHEDNSTSSAAVPATINELCVNDLLIGKGSATYSSQLLTALVGSVTHKHITNKSNELAEQLEGAQDLGPVIGASLVDIERIVSRLLQAGGPSAKAVAFTSQFVASHLSTLNLSTAAPASSSERKRYLRVVAAAELYKGILHPFAIDVTHAPSCVKEMAGEAATEVTSLPAWSLGGNRHVGGLYPMPDPRMFVGGQHVLPPQFSEQFVLAMDPIYRLMLIAETKSTVSLSTLMNKVAPRILSYKITFVNNCFHKDARLAQKAKVDERRKQHQLAMQRYQSMVQQIIATHQQQGAYEHHHHMHHHQQQLQLPPPPPPPQHLELFPPVLSLQSSDVLYGTTRTIKHHVGIPTTALVVYKSKSGRKGTHVKRARPLPLHGHTSQGRLRQEDRKATLVAEDEVLSGGWPGFLAAAVIATRVLHGVASNTTSTTGESSALDTVAPNMLRSLMGIAVSTSAGLTMEPNRRPMASWVSRAHSTQLTLLSVVLEDCSRAHPVVPASTHYPTEVFPHLYYPLTGTSTRGSLALRVLYPSQYELQIYVAQRLLQKWAKPYVQQMALSYAQQSIQNSDGVAAAVRHSSGLSTTRTLLLVSPNSIAESYIATNGDGAGEATSTTLAKFSELNNSANSDDAKANSSPLASPLISTLLDDSSSTTVKALLIAKEDMRSLTTAGRARQHTASSASDRIEGWMRTLVERQRVNVLKSILSQTSRQNSSDIFLFHPSLLRSKHRRKRTTRGLYLAAQRRLAETTNKAATAAAVRVAGDFSTAGSESGATTDGSIRSNSIHKASSSTRAAVRTRSSNNEDSSASSASPRRDPNSSRSQQAKNSSGASLSGGAGGNTCNVTTFPPTNRESLLPPIESGKGRYAREVLSVITLSESGSYCGSDPLQLIRSIASKRANFDASGAIPNLLLGNTSGARRQDAPAPAAQTGSPRTSSTNPRGQTLRVPPTAVLNPRHLGPGALTAAAALQCPRRASKRPTRNSARLGKQRAPPSMRRATQLFGSDGSPLTSSASDSLELNDSSSDDGGHTAGASIHDRVRSRTEKFNSRAHKIPTHGQRDENLSLFISVVVADSFIQSDVQHMNNPTADNVALLEASTTIDAASEAPFYASVRSTTTQNNNASPLRPDDSSGNLGAGMGGMSSMEMSASAVARARRTRVSEVNAAVQLNTRYAMLGAVRTAYRRAIQVTKTSAQIGDARLKTEFAAEAAEKLASMNAAAAASHMSVAAGVDVDGGIPTAVVVEPSSPKRGSGSTDVTLAGGPTFNQLSEERSTKSAISVVDPSQCQDCQEERLQIMRYMMPVLVTIEGAYTPFHSALFAPCPSLATTLDARAPNADRCGTNPGSPLQAQMQGSLSSFDMGGNLGSKPANTHPVAGVPSMVRGVGGRGGVHSPYTSSLVGRTSHQPHISSPPVGAAGIQRVQQQQQQQQLYPYDDSGSDMGGGGGDTNSSTTNTLRGSSLMGMSALMGSIFGGLNSTTNTFPLLPGGAAGVRQSRMLAVPGGHRLLSSFQLIASDYLKFFMVFAPAAWTLASALANAPPQELRPHALRGVATEGTSTTPYLAPNGGTGAGSSSKLAGGRGIISSGGGGGDGSYAILKTDRPAHHHRAGHDSDTASNSSMGSVDKAVVAYATRVQKFVATSRQQQQQQPSSWAVAVGGSSDDNGGVGVQACGIGGTPVAGGGRLQWGTSSQHRASASSCIAGSLVGRREERQLCHRHYHLDTECRKEEAARRADAMAAEGVSEGYPSSDPLSDNHRTSGTAHSGRLYRRNTLLNASPLTSVAAAADSLWGSSSLNRRISNCPPALRTRRVKVFPETATNGSIFNVADLLAQFVAGEISMLPTRMVHSINSAEGDYVDGDGDGGTTIPSQDATLATTVDLSVSLLAMGLSKGLQRSELFSPLVPPLEVDGPPLSDVSLSLSRERAKEVTGSPTPSALSQDHHSYRHADEKLAEGAGSSLEGSFRKLPHHQLQPCAQDQALHHPYHRPLLMPPVSQGPTVRQWLASVLVPTASGFTNTADETPLLVDASPQIQSTLLRALGDLLGSAPLCSNSVLYLLNQASLHRRAANTFGGPPSIGSSTSGMGRHRLQAAIRSPALAVKAASQQHLPPVSSLVRGRSDHFNPLTTENNNNGGSSQETEWDTTHTHRQPHHHLAQTKTISSSSGDAPLTSTVSKRRLSDGVDARNPDIVKDESDFDMKTPASQQMPGHAPLNGSLPLPPSSALSSPEDPTATLPTGSDLLASTAVHSTMQSMLSASSPTSTSCVYLRNHMLTSATTGHHLASILFNSAPLLPHLVQCSASARQHLRPVVPPINPAEVTMSKFRTYMAPPRGTIPSIDNDLLSLTTVLFGDDIRFKRTLVAANRVSNQQVCERDAQLLGMLRGAFTDENQALSKFTESTPTKDLLRKSDANLATTFAINSQSLRTPASILPAGCTSQLFVPLASLAKSQRAALTEEDVILLSTTSLRGDAKAGWSKGGGGASMGTPREAGSKPLSQATSGEHASANGGTTQRFPTLKALHSTNSLGSGNLPGGGLINESSFSSQGGPLSTNLPATAAAMNASHTSTLKGNTINNRGGLGQRGGAGVASSFPYNMGSPASSHIASTSLTVIPPTGEGDASLVSPSLSLVPSRSALAITTSLHNASLVGTLAGAAGVHCETLFQNLALSHHSCLGPTASSTPFQSETVPIPAPGPSICLSTVNLRTIFSTPPQRMTTDISSIFFNNYNNNNSAAAAAHSSASSSSPALPAFPVVSSSGSPQGAVATDANISRIGIASSTEERQSLDEPTYRYAISMLNSLTPQASTLQTQAFGRAVANPNFIILTASTDVWACLGPEDVSVFFGMLGTPDWSSNAASTDSFAAMLATAMSSASAHDGAVSNTANVQSQYQQAPRGALSNPPPKRPGSASSAAAHHASLWEYVTGKHDVLHELHGFRRAYTGPGLSAVEGSGLHDHFTSGSLRGWAGFGCNTPNPSRRGSSSVGDRSCGGDDGNGRQHSSANGEDSITSAGSSKLGQSLPYPIQTSPREYLEFFNVQHYCSNFGPSCPFSTYVAESLQRSRMNDHRYRRNDGASAASSATQSFVVEGGGGSGLHGQQGKYASSAAESKPSYLSPGLVQQQQQQRGAPPSAKGHSVDGTGGSSVHSGPQQVVGSLTSMNPSPDAITMLSTLLLNITRTGRIRGGRASYLLHRIATVLQVEDDCPALDFMPSAATATKGSPPQKYQPSSPPTLKLLSPHSMCTADKTIHASRYTDNLAVGECDCLLLSIKVLLMYGDYYFPSNLKQLSNDLTHCFNREHQHGDNASVKKDPSGRFHQHHHPNNQPPPQQPPHLGERFLFSEETKHKNCMWRHNASPWWKEACVLQEELEQHVAGQWVPLPDFVNASFQHLQAGHAVPLLPSCYAGDGTPLKLEREDSELLSPSLFPKPPLVDLVGCSPSPHPPAIPSSRTVSDGGTHSCQRGGGGDNIQYLPLPSIPPPPPLHVRLYRRFRVAHAQLSRQQRNEDALSRGYRGARYQYSNYAASQMGVRDPQGASALHADEISLRGTPQPRLSRPGLLVSDALKTSSQEVVQKTHRRASRVVTANALLRQQGADPHTSGAAAVAGNNASTNQSSGSGGGGKSPLTSATSHNGQRPQGSSYDTSPSSKSGDDFRNVASVLSEVVVHEAEAISKLRLRYTLVRQALRQRAQERLELAKLYFNSVLCDARACWLREQGMYLIAVQGHSQGTHSRLQSIVQEGESQGSSSAMWSANSMPLKGSVQLAAPIPVGANPATTTASNGRQHSNTTFVPDDQDPAGTPRLYSLHDVPKHAPIRAVLLQCPQQGQLMVSFATMCLEVESLLAEEISHLWESYQSVVAQEISGRERSSDPAASRHTQEGAGASSSSAGASTSTSTMSAPAQPLGAQALCPTIAAFVSSPLTTSESSLIRFSDASRIKLEKLLSFRASGGGPLSEDEGLDDEQDAGDVPSELVLLATATKNGSIGKTIKLLENHHTKIRKDLSRQKFDNRRTRDSDFYVEGTTGGGGPTGSAAASEHNTAARRKGGNMLSLESSGSLSDGDPEQLPGHLAADSTASPRAPTPSGQKRLRRRGNKKRSQHPKKNNFKALHEWSSHSDVYASSEEEEASHLSHTLKKTIAAMERDYIKGIGASASLRKGQAPISANIQNTETVQYMKPLHFVAQVLAFK